VISGEVLVTTGAVEIDVDTLAGHSTIVCLSSFGFAPQEADRSGVPIRSHAIKLSRLGARPQD
jgi:hypothetical protein